MATMAYRGVIYVAPTLKVNTPQPLIFNEAKSAREIDNFTCGLEAYEWPMGIKDEAQKVSNTSLFLTDISAHVVAKSM